MVEEAVAHVEVSKTKETAEARFPSSGSRTSEIEPRLAFNKTVVLRYKIHPWCGSERVEWPLERENNTGRPTVTVATTGGRLRCSR